MSARWLKGTSNSPGLTIGWLKPFIPLPPFAFETSLFFASMSTLFLDATTAEAGHIVTNSYLYWMATAILYYDHILSLPREIQFIWTRKRSSVAYGFLFNRYLAFFGNLVVAILYYTEPVGSCRRLKLLRQSLLVVTEVTVCVLLGTRTYALYLSDRRILYLIVPILVVGTGLSCWSLLVQARSNVHVAPLGCDEKLSFRSSIFLAMGWESLLVCDLVIFYLTFRKTYKSTKESKQWGSGRITLPNLLLKDQAIYFFGMAVANFANIMTFYFAPPYLKGSLTQFASIISVTLLSRQMLNLYGHLSTPLGSSTWDSQPVLTTLRFSESIGSDEDACSGQGAFGQRSRYA